MKSEEKNKLNNRVEEKKILAVRALKLLECRTRFAMLNTLNGRNNSKEKRQMFRQILANLKAEKANLATLYDVISEGVNSHNYSEVSVMACLDSLEKRNKEMFEYYSQYLESSIYKAVSVGKPRTLESGYSNDVGSLSITMNDVKAYLSYMGPDFWNYISEKQRILPCDDAVAFEGAFGVINLMSQNTNTICDLIAIVPRVHDLASAKAACKVYVQAYKVYKSFGKEKVSDAVVEDENRILERFESQYLEHTPARVRVSSLLRPAKRKETSNK